MAPAPVRVESEGPVCVVRMDDGKVNAMSREFIAVLDQALAAAVASGRPVVIASSAKAYSAGLDLKQVQGLDRDGWRVMFGGLHHALAQVLDAPQPVVAAIGGPAIAGGAILALACDHRVASPQAQIGVPELQVGVPFPPAVIDLMLDRLPAPTIRSTVLDARRVSGEEALATGWADELAADPVQGAVAAAKRLDARNRAGFAMLKRRVNAAVIASVRDAAALEGHLDLLVAEPTRRAIAEGVAATLKKA